MPLKEFIDKYYIAPIYNDALGYNYVNSITYGLIAAALLFFIYKYFEKEKLKIDMRFFWSLFPFILFGAFTRVLVDKSIVPTTFWTVSPGIYLLTAGLFLAIIVVSHFIEKKTKFDYWKISFISGAILLLAEIFYYGRYLSLAKEHYFGLYIIGLAVLIFLVISSILKKIWTWFDKICTLPLFAHLLDASATFIAVGFLGFSEKHPLPALLSAYFGTPAIMFVLKLVIIIPAIYYIKKDLKNENLQNYFLIAIAVLGFAEGIRDLLAVVFV